MQAAREDAVEERRLAKDREDDAALLAVMDRVDPDRKGYGYTRLRDLARLRGDRMTRAVERLINEGIIEEVDGYTAAVGSGARKPCRALRRTTIGTNGTDHRDGPS